MFPGSYSSYSGLIPASEKCKYEQGCGRIMNLVAQPVPPSPLITRPRDLVWNIQNTHTRFSIWLGTVFSQPFIGFLLGYGVHFGILNNGIWSDLIYDDYIKQTPGYILLHFSPLIAPFQWDPQMNRYILDQSKNRKKVLISPIIAGIKTWALHGYIQCL